MPNLQQLLADAAGYPQQTGEPTAIVAVPPSARIPTTQQGDVVDEALGVLGEHTSALGATLEAHAALQERQAAAAALRLQAAQVKIDSQNAENAAQQQLDSFVAQSLQDPDTRNHPVRVQQYAAELTSAMGQALSPQARATFQANFGAYATLAHRSALKTSRDADITSGVALADDNDLLFQQQIMRATTPDQQALAVTVYHRKQQDLVETGIITPGDAQLRQTKAFAAVTQQQITAATIADPMGMAEQSRLAAAGKPQQAHLPTIPADLVSPTIKLAQEQLQHQAATQDRVERRAQQATQQLQAQAAVNLRTRLTELNPVPGNLGAYDGMLKEINDQASRGLIDDAAQKELLTLQRTLRAVAFNPPQANDQELERNLTIRVLRSTTPEEFAATRDMVYGAAGQLTTDSWRSLVTTMDERAKSTHYSHQPGYIQGRAILEQGTIPGTSVLGRLSNLKTQEAIRLRTALDIYDRRMAEIASEPGGLPKMEAQAVATAYEVRKTYLDDPALSTADLPLILQGAQSQEEATAILQKAPHLTDRMRSDLLEQWKEVEKKTYPQGRPQPVTPAQPIRTPGLGERVRNFFTWPIGGSPSQETPPTQTPPAPGAPNRTTIPGVDTSTIGQRSH